VRKKREMSSKQVGKHAVEAQMCFTGDMFAWKKERKKIRKVCRLDKKELCNGNRKVRYTRQVRVEEAAKETEEGNVS
jgi:hypothetical protein